MLNSERKLLMSHTDLYDEAKKRYAELIATKGAIEELLANAPPGKIHVVKSDKRVQFYLREDCSDKSGKYISKTNENLIRTYLQKAYYEKALKSLCYEILHLEKFLTHTKNICDKIQKLYSDNPIEVRQYINPIDISDADYIKIWKNVTYIGKEVNAQLSYFKTENNELVRSKSELNIANMLCKYGIPYKYECPLRLNNGKVIYPDFTVLDIKARKEIYWEHRGMMDDRHYATDSVMRIKLMMKNNIYLGDNLIITEETSMNPLGTDEIEIIIKRFLR